MDKRVMTLAAAAAVVLSAVAMPKNPQAAERWFDDLFVQPETLPVTFTYADQGRCGLGGLPVLARHVDETENGKKGRLVCRLDDEMSVTLEAAWCREFNEVEYTLWFANTGKQPTKTLKDIFVYRGFVDGTRPRLRGSLGDHENFYAAYDSDLEREPRTFISTNGRATHIVFPYFNFVHGNGGTLMALGWAGTWSAGFLGTRSATAVMASTCLDFEASLLPGERVRTGLVVLLPYEGRDSDHATNLWRAWFQKYNMPRANARGDRIQPFSTMCFAGDTGLPNSDGSISERATTWKRTLDKLVEERMVPDFRWFDAGWYCDPANRSVPTDWWGTVGTWEIDRVKWPGDSFRESNEACHAQNMKVLVWFEPERVTHLDDLVRNYGYKREWGIETGHCITSNIGDEDCLAWTLGRIVKMLGEHAVDLYREDNNSNPATAWNMLDTREMKKYKLPRRGVNENKCIQGHYRLWDGILDFCAKNGKCTYLDSCASGGGRNDIESMRRGIPFMRSDFDRTTIPMRLSQSWGFNKWIPFHGSSTKDTVGQLDGEQGAGSDVYTVRASYLPVYNYGDAVSHRKEIDFDLMRRNYAEWKSVRHLLTRDFYTLTPWHATTFQEGWTAFAYDAPEKGESIVLAFRMEKAETADFTARLKFADIGAAYEVENVDTGVRQTYTGWELRENGLPIRLAKPRSSALLKLKRLTQTGSAPRVHSLAKALVENLSMDAAVCPDPAGGMWSFHSRKKVDDATEEAMISVPFDGTFEGYRSPHNEFPLVMLSPQDDWTVIPGVAGGRTDRPFKPMEFQFHPAPADKIDKCRAVVRFTASRRGVYALYANVRAMNAGPGCVDVSVLVKGKIVWQRELVRDGASYAELPPLALKELALEAGDVIEFVVGPGLGEADHRCDGTGVQLTILEI